MLFQPPLNIGCDTCVQAIVTAAENVDVPVHLRLAAGPAEHELVAIGVFTHCQMRRFAVFRLRFALTLAAGSPDLGCPGNYVSHLEGQSGPCLFAFPAPVDGNESACDRQFGNVGILPLYRGPENGLVKRCRPAGIRGPDGVLEFFNLHGSTWQLPFQFHKGVTQTGGINDAPFLVEDHPGHEPRGRGRQFGQGKIRPGHAIGEAFVDLPDQQLALLC